MPTLIDVTPEEQAAQRNAVLAEAMTWLRTPYHKNQGLKGVGVDCVWFLIGVYHNVGLTPEIDPGHYNADHALHSSEELYVDWVQRYAQRVDKPRAGDVVLYKVGRSFSHSAIVISWPQIAHASMLDRGVCLTDARKCHRLLTNKDGTPRDHEFFTLWK